MTQQNLTDEIKNNESAFPWSNLDIDTIVSIDFGSFGFAASFCPTNAPEHQRMVENWTDSRVATELNKNLAALLIEKETKETVSVGYEAEEMWTKAQQKKEDHKYMYFEHFKPYLYSTDHLKKNIEVPSADGKSSLPLSELIIKSLKAVMEHSIFCINELNKLAGLSLLTTKNIFWVISVPAIWDEMSKEMMKYCAKKSGMRHCELGSEPIAATFQVLNSQNKEFRLKPSDKIMILDCGGGTIDAACIECISMDSKSFELSELHHGDGIRAGGLDVDTEFIKLLEDLLPNDIVDAVKMRQPAQWLKQKNEFVMAKFSCPFDLDEPWNVPFCFGINGFLSKMRKKNKQEYSALKKQIAACGVLDLEQKYESKQNGGEDQKEPQTVSGMIKLGRSNLKIQKKAWLQLHEQVLSKIINFVRGLFQNGSVNGCSKVIVVGGFANSKYLIKRLVAEFPHKTFFSPRAPHLAVVKGALYWICQRQHLTKTRAKYSYGIAIDRRFNPNQDSEMRRKETAEGAIVENAFNALVIRDDEYENGYEEVFGYWIPANANHLEIILYASEDKFCKYVFDESGTLPTEKNRKCFEVKKFKIAIDSPSEERMEFQIRLRYNQNGIDLHYIDPNDGTDKKVEVDTTAKPQSKGSNVENDSKNI